MKLHYPHTLWRYTVCVRKAQLSHGHRSPPLPRQSSTQTAKNRYSDITKITSSAFAAEYIQWTFTQCFGENGKNRILPLSLKWGLISVTVIKWHRLQLIMIQWLFNILIIVMNSTQTPTISTQKPSSFMNTKKINK